MFEKEILELFKVMVVPQEAKQVVNTDFVSLGVVTDFTPSLTQQRVLRDKYAPLNVTVLFTVQEREQSDPFDLITKQLYHYVEVYGLLQPGLFNLEVSDGKVVNMVYIRGVTVDELGTIVRKLLFTNAPVKDSEVVKKIIDYYRVKFDINEVKNNELRVILFRPEVDSYNSGDDAVRYLCYQATESALLIKSPEVISAMNEYANSGISLNKFLKNHEIVLAQVFNRHKRLIIALKTKETAAVINRISRLSKTKHVPIKEAINKRFVGEALKGNIADWGVLDKMSIRDKFKFLNLLEYKKEGLEQDAFVIRNGKVHLEKGRQAWSKRDIDSVINRVLGSIEIGLEALKGKNILLDKHVHYGLPISRKQTIGNLPFGSQINVESKQISSGIYWENSGGARDLDLSTVDVKGNRTGWGVYSGYDRDNPVTFSGDLTDARDGAMEFMTSKVNSDLTYGLFVNIFAGEIGSKMKLVVGEKTDERWIENPVVREEHTLNSKGNVIGFVKDGKFVVYTCRLNQGRVSTSEKNKAIVSRGISNFWTINSLFDKLNIKYDLDRNEDKKYDYDLSYDKYTSDTLEGIFSI